MRLNCGFVYKLTAGVASLGTLGSLPGGVLRLSLYCRCDRRLLPFPRWVGYSFIIHYPVVHNHPPSVCGIKRLAINEALLLVDS